MFAIYIVGALVLGAFGMWAQYKTKSNFEKYSRVRASSGLTGAQAALSMLQRAGVSGVKVERVGGFLSDHYDPRTNVIRLSPDVHDGHSLSALGVACHEAGHALQHAQKYPLMVLRSIAVPVASFGSGAGMLILMAGLIMNVMGLAAIGLVLFAGVVVFQLINLPVEFDATARAKKALVQSGLIQPGAEQQGVAKVLDAAALTYVAATLSAVFTLLYYAMIVFGGRRE